MVAMTVLHRVESRIGAVQGACGDNTDLLPEVDEAFEDQRLWRQDGKCVCDVVLASQQRLALAVITKPGRLQHGGQADPIDCRPQRFEIVDRCP